MSRKDADQGTPPKGRCAHGWRLRAHCAFCTGERPLQSDSLPLPCIFCKRPTTVMGGLKHWVACTNRRCVADSPLRKTRREAIQAHNAMRRRVNGG